jgi:hypothetical protein
MKALSSNETTLEEENSELLSANNKLAKDLSVATAAAAKSDQMLQDRTDGWMSWRDRSQEEVAKVKQAARRRIMALEKKYHVELTKECSLLYKTEREHTKRLVALDNEVAKVSAGAEKEVTNLEEVYYSKVT